MLALRTGFFFQHRFMTLKYPSHYEFSKVIFKIFFNSRMFALHKTLLFSKKKILSNHILVPMYLSKKENESCFTYRMHLYKHTENCFTDVEPFFSN